jgi:ferredoxin/flavodoxin---NADP+ reductase
MDLDHDPILSAPPGFFAEEVTWVHHWTDRLFSFKCSREPSWRFTSGQFAMIGLVVGGKPLTRAYSMVSPAWEDHLEFLSIKVPNGPLTSRLQHIRVGERVLIGKKPVGTLIPDNLLPGRNLWFLATGTGLAPFMSLMRDPDVYERYERVIVAHTVREAKELAYRDYITGELRAHELLGEMVSEKLIYLPAVTREPFPVQGRITTRLEAGDAERQAGVAKLDPEFDRVMICGSEAMNADCKALLEARGFIEGTNNAPGSYVVEKAFVTK